jgi:hypothetical protein
MNNYSNLREPIRIVKLIINDKHQIINYPNTSSSGLKKLTHKARRVMPKTLVNKPQKKLNSTSNRLIQ